MTEGCRRRGAHTITAYASVMYREREGRGDGIQWMMYKYC